MKHIFIIDNRSSRTSSFDYAWKIDSIYKDIEEYFEAQDNQEYSIITSKMSRDTMILVQNQINKSKEDDLFRVYAIGGNEILFDCLNSIAGLPNMELAIVPFEDTCDFLHSFGKGKAELFQNIISMIEAPVIPTDIIYTERLYAINSCVIGFESAKPFVMKKLQKRFGEDIVGLYFFNKLIDFFGHISTMLDKKIVSQYYKLVIDDIDYSGNYYLLVIANGAYHSEDKVTISGAVPDDGLLDIALFRSSGFFQNISSMRKYSRGEIPSNYVHIQAKKISIQSDEQIWIQLDGESFQDNKFNLEVVPGALQIAAINNLTYQRS